MNKLREFSEWEGFSYFAELNYLGTRGGFESGLLSAGGPYYVVVDNSDCRDTQPPSNGEDNSAYINIRFTVTYRVGALAEHKLLIFDFGFFLVYVVNYFSRRRATPIPIPPPMHINAIACSFPSVSRMCWDWPIILAPLAPRGCPIEIAPP